MCTTICEYKKDYLRRYLNAKKKVKELALEMEEIEGQYIMAAKAYDGMPHGKGGTSDLSTFAAKYDEVYRQLKEMLERSMDAYKEVSDAIEQSDCNETERCILRYRYILGYTWEKIAVVMELSYQWVCELHGRALNGVSLDRN